MDSARKRLRYPADWIRRKAEGGRISMLTCYDAGMAKLLARTPVDALLIGDSLAMTVQGQSSTLPVTLAEMIYHCRMVRRGAPDMFLVGDLPFASYQASISDGMHSALEMMKTGGVDAVKLEGAAPDTLEIIRRLCLAGVPVMGHAGLTPQSFMITGGFKVQGRAEADAERILGEARALEAAGCFAIILELTAAPLSRCITAELKIPTIGIGAGPETNGQVLVLHDLLGLDPEFHARHQKRYAELGQEIIRSAEAYAREVQDRIFPGPENTFS